MSTTDRYNPTPDAEYGLCLTCDITFDSEEAAKTHMQETLAASTDRRSHSTRTMNPSREARVKNAVGAIIEDALHSALSEIDDLIARDHITEEEAETAIRSEQIDMADAWMEYNS